MDDRCEVLGLKVEYWNVGSIGGGWKLDDMIVYCRARQLGLCCMVHGRC